MKYSVLCAKTQQSDVVNSGRGALDQNAGGGRSVRAVAGSPVGEWSFDRGRLRPVAVVSCDAEGASELEASQAPLTRHSAINRLLPLANSAKIDVDFDQNLDFSDDSADFFRTVSALSSASAVTGEDYFKNYQRDGLPTWFRSRKIFTTRRLHCRQIGPNRLEVVNRSVPVQVKTAGFAYNARNSNDIRDIFKSRKRVKDLILANEDIFDFFFTLTLNKDKVDRSDGKTAQQKISTLFKNLGVRFVYVPELHADKKAYHFHGVASSDVFQYLKEFNRRDYYPYTAKKLPVYILDALDKGQKVFYLPQYQRSLGWCTFTPIKNKTACAVYVTKYMTKDIARIGRRRFYASKGLRHPQKILFSANLLKRFVLAPVAPFAKLACRFSLVRRDSLPPDLLALADSQQQALLSAGAVPLDDLIAGAIVAGSAEFIRRTSPPAVPLFQD